MISNDTSSTTEVSRAGSEEGGCKSPQSDITVPDSQSSDMMPLASVPADEWRKMQRTLLELFSENILAKMLRVAVEALENNVWMLMTMAVESMWFNSNIFLPF